MNAIFIVAHMSLKFPLELFVFQYIIYIQPKIFAKKFFGFQGIWKISNLYDYRSYDIHIEIAYW